MMTQSSLCTDMELLEFLEVGEEILSHIYTEGGSGQERRGSGVTPGVARPGRHHTHKPRLSGRLEGFNPQLGNDFLRI
jgi:hypothetical protein